MGALERLPELRLLVRPRHLQERRLAIRTATAAGFASRCSRSSASCRAAGPRRPRRSSASAAADLERSLRACPRPAGRSRSPAPALLRVVLRPRSSGATSASGPASSTTPSGRSPFERHGLVASAAARLLRRAVSASGAALLWYRRLRGLPGPVRPDRAGARRPVPRRQVRRRGGLQHRLPGHERGPERAHRGQVPQAPAGARARRSSSRSSGASATRAASTTSSRRATSTSCAASRAARRSRRRRARSCPTRCSSGSRASRSPTSSPTGAHAG